MALSFESLRVGGIYRIINYRETIDFKVVEISEMDIKATDINSLEDFYLNEIIEYGIGDDYDLYELENDR